MSDLVLLLKLSLLMNKSIEEMRRNVSPEEMRLWREYFQREHK